MSAAVNGIMMLLKSFLPKDIEPEKMVEDFKQALNFLAESHASQMRCEKMLLELYRKEFKREWTDIYTNAPIGLSSSNSGGNGGVVAGRGEQHSCEQKSPSPPKSSHIGVSDRNP